MIYIDWVCSWHLLKWFIIKIFSLSFILQLLRHICWQLKQITKGDIYYYYYYYYCDDAIFICAPSQPVSLSWFSLILRFALRLVLRPVRAPLSRWFITSKRLALINFWLGQKRQTAQDVRTPNGCSRLSSLLFSSLFSSLVLVLVVVVPAAAFVVVVALLGVAFIKTSWNDSA